MSNEKLDPDAKPMNVHAKLREAQEQLRESRRREMDLAEACRDACMERDQAIAETAEQCAQVCDKLAASIFTTEKIRNTYTALKNVLVLSDRGSLTSRSMSRGRLSHLPKEKTRSGNVCR